MQSQEEQAGLPQCLSVLSAPLSITYTTEQGVNLNPQTL